MSADRQKLRKQLLAMEQGLRQVNAHLDNLNDEEVQRMGEEVDQLAFRYAKVLNLHVEDM